MKPEEIRRTREALGHTQTEFARRIGLGPKGTTVSKWESGKHAPHPVFVRRIREIAKEER